MLYPVNPNLAYMSENIYELYQLYLALRKLILEYKLIDRKINKYILPTFDSEKASDFYYRGEYRKCYNSIKNCKEPQEKWLLFQCLLKMGKQEESYKILQELLISNKLELVAFRVILLHLFLKMNR
jgi:cobalamin biosynthesis Co2+ chelatase CbiK